MSMIVSPERNALSALASRHPELAARPPASAKRFSLEDGQKLHYWGERNDLHIATSHAVGFGLGANGGPAIKKPAITANFSRFFFLFGGEKGKTRVELLELDPQKSKDARLVFRPTGHTDTFTNNIF